MPKKLSDGDLHVTFRVGQQNWDESSALSSERPTRNSERGPYGHASRLMNAAALHSGALIGQYESQRTTELLEGGTQQQQEGQDLVQLRSGHHSSSLPFGGEGEAVKQAEQHPGNGQPIDTNRQLDFQSFETHAMEAGKPRHSLGEGYVHTKGEVEDQEAAAKVALLASSTSNGSSSRHQRKETYGFYPASSISNPGADGARQIALLQSALSKRLGPEYISTRSGPSGGKCLSRS